MVTGPILTGIVEKLRASNIESPGYKLVAEDGLPVGILVPDVLKEVKYGIPLQCLPVRSETDFWGEYLYTNGLYNTNDATKLNEAAESAHGSGTTKRRRH